MDNTFLCLTEASWTGIQAIATIFTFAVLIWYAIETWKIRKATLSQAEASRRPFIRAIRKTDMDGLSSGVLFINQGSGPILKLKAAYLKSETANDPFYNGAVGVQEEFYAALAEAKFMNFEDITDRGVRFTYSDTAGKPYWTTIQLRNGIYVSDTGEE